MIEEIGAAVEDYLQQWQQLGADHEQLLAYRSNAVGWKVADEAQYKQCYQELRSECDQVVETWMNGRWIAKMHLKQTALPGDITIIKLMQRRPGSSDSLGLDHLDFQCKDIRRAEAVLQDSDLRWSWETNDIMPDYNWLSVWFNDSEAKIKEGTVIDIVIRELQELEV